ncbi:MAG: hypothetical protein HYU67_05995 [Flavobacteriia bacterium]|nr:hypothetical protein [Flavobacteriia bacterium]
MKIKDLTPFVEDALDKKGKKTGQKFISYGKIVDIQYTNNKTISTVSVLQVYEIQKYLSETSLIDNNYQHCVRAFSLQDLPQEFKSILNMSIQRKINDK